MLFLLALSLVVLVRPSQAETLAPSATVADAAQPAIGEKGDAIACTDDIDIMPDPDAPSFDTIRFLRPAWPAKARRVNEVTDAACGATPLQLRNS